MKKTFRKKTLRNKTLRKKTIRKIRGGYKFILKLENDDKDIIQKYLKEYPEASYDEIIDKEFPAIFNEFNKNVLAQIEVVRRRAILKKNGLNEYHEF